MLEHQFFRDATSPAAEAVACPCQGGCASRRALDGNLAGHDEYCPWVRGERIDLPWSAAPTMNLVRSRNVCTTIVV